MDIFSKANKMQAQAHKKDATIVKIEKYELDRNPAKCTIIGTDMFNNDENGVPKKVKVHFYDKSGKSQNIQDYADEGSMSHTMPGGMVRLDKVQVRADGSYVCSHMQRVSKKDGPRTDRTGNQYDTKIARAWVKALPNLDDTGAIATYKTGSGLPFSRGRTLVVPEDSKGQNLVMGPDFREQFKAAAKAAIEQAPEKTKPLLLLRQPDNNNSKEVVIPNQRQDESGNYVLMTKQEQIDVIDNLKAVQTFYTMSDSEDAAGVELEAVPGFQLDMHGFLNDPKSGQPLEKPRVQSFVNETTRTFVLPQKPGEKERQTVPHDKREYKLAVISYDIPSAEEARSATLQTLGTVPGHTASPNAGLTVTPNPYYEDSKVTAAVEASEKAQASQAAAVPPASTQAPGRSEQPAPQATQEAAQTQQTPANTMTPQEASAYEDADLSDALDDAVEDFDMDDLESQLSSQGL